MSDAILVVEDQIVNLKLVLHLLKHEGYTVTQAMDGETALAMIRAAPPALVLLDLQLPKMDGFEVARQVKADERTRHVCLVALTAHAMKGDAEKALAAGCNACIIKPFDTRRFTGQVAEFLAAARLASETSKSR